jgi:hypothetical protein
LAVAGFAAVPRAEVPLAEGVALVVAAAFAAGATAALAAVERVRRVADAGCSVADAVTVVVVRRGDPAATVLRALAGVEAVVGAVWAAVVVAAARVAADLVVAFLAAAIVVLLEEFSRILRDVRGWVVRVDGFAAVCPGRFAVARCSGVLLVLAFPPFVFGVPRFVALLDFGEGLLSFCRRIIGAESIPSRAHVGLGLDPLVRKAPVVPLSTAAAHDITVHRK